MSTTLPWRGRKIVVVHAQRSCPARVGPFQLGFLASTSSYSSYSPPSTSSSYTPPTLGGSVGAKPSVFCTGCGHSNSGGSITCFSCSALLGGGGQPSAPASNIITVRQEPQGATERCPCGTAYAGTSQFCTGCGQKKSAASTAAAGGNCTGCGTAYVGSSQFCTGCGQKKEAAATPLQAAAATSSASNCASCGTAYGSSQFCTGCGTKKAAPIAAAAPAAAAAVAQSDLLRTQSGQPLVLAAAAVDDAPQDPFIALLVSAQLTHFEEALRELGCATPADLADLDDSDCEEIGEDNQSVL